MRGQYISPSLACGSSDVSSLPLPSLLMRWSICRRHEFPSSILTRYCRGPSLEWIRPGVHLGPGWKFLSITKSPSANSLFLAQLSCFNFCIPWRSLTCFSTLGCRRSNLVRTYLPRNRELGATAVVACGVVRYCSRKLARENGKLSPSRKLACKAFFSVWMNRSTAPF